VLRARWQKILAELETTGTYTHTVAELDWAGKVAWRNSVRCVGRLHWRSLRVLDARLIATPEAQETAIRRHLKLATNAGKIRPRVTIFPPARPGVAETRIFNRQLIAYAWWSDLGKGDRANAALTEVALAHGWRPPQSRGQFDVLPILLDRPGQTPHWFEWEPDDVLQIPISHERYPVVATLGWKWHAVPALCDFALEAGGIRYPTALLNGWYMGTEIASRNLVDGDRYAGLPELGRGLGLNLCEAASLWQDEALLVLNQAVIRSFQAAGVTLVDHHIATAEFMQFCQREEAAGRSVVADWAWIIPPMSPAATPVWDQTWPCDERDPRFARRPTTEVY
jgi:nitric-oxide synthase